MHRSFALVTGLFVSLVTPVFAQNARVTLNGHVRRQAELSTDDGAAEDSLKLRHVTIFFAQTAQQETDLENLLARQQDPGSADYHHWLKPEEYAARFGASDAAVNQVKAWLQGQNLTVDSVGHGRSTISFSGNVRDVEKAFAAPIHRYTYNGESHFANAAEPSVPAAVAGLVRLVHGLDDFRMKPAHLKQQNPLYTSATTGRTNLAPGDVSTIFNIAPLYSSGITGKGQSIVVVGQTRVDLTDIEAFRTYFGLPANDPQTMLVPNTRDPGISKSDLPEADLDLEWSGAIARDASITFIYSYNVTDALIYAIDNNVAPVISTSYGLCEALDGSEVATLQAASLQAQSQGISWMAASGDSGANDCYGLSRSVTGLSVDVPASIPYVTGVGGTTLTEGTGTYWNSTNDANKASALSYIPESVWNDTAADGSPSSSGGGASIVFAKPAWQTGTGVPADGARDVPDVSMPASADHDGYLVYTGGALAIYGGTSVGAPVMAGITGLLNQYVIAQGIQKTPGLGSLNPRLYAIAQTAPNAFHDITAGNNIVNSCSGSRGCVPTPVGFNATAGYDQATGLGSVDVFNLATSWNASATTSAAPAIQGVTNGASYKQSYAPGEIVSIFGTNLAGSTSTFAAAPLPRTAGTFAVTVNGVDAPLYYVSPTQINLQIPYEIAAGSAATLTVVAGGQSATSKIALAASAPGIFTDVNGYVAGAGSDPVTNTRSVRRSQTIDSYITGDGLFAPPSVTTGTTPAALLQLPTGSSVSVTVGGIGATLVFAGVPTWSVGVTQINFTVPSTAPLGKQPVVITTNGVASATAYLNVTQ